MVWAWKIMDWVSLATMENAKDIIFQPTMVAVLHSLVSTLEKLF